MVSDHLSVFRGAVVLVRRCDDDIGHHYFAFVAAPSCGGEAEHFRCEPSSNAL